MSKPRVFISYVSENYRKVRRLAEALRSAGVEVWLDKAKIKPGADWQEAIREAIFEGGYFLACFSKAYWNRESTYMNEELNLAIDMVRERRSTQSFLIPVLLEPSEIPPEKIRSGKTLRDLQRVELYKDWRKAIAGILSVIQTEAPGRLLDTWTLAMRKLQRRSRGGRRAAPSVLVAGDTPWDVFWLARRGMGHQQHAYMIPEAQFDVLETIERPGTVFACAALLSEFGFRVRCLTALGSDSYSALIRKAYADAGVDLIEVRNDAATLRRHYLMEAVGNTPQDQGVYKQITRINHEPACSFKDMPGPAAGRWTRPLRQGLREADYILVNDTHKGTLSRHGEGDNSHLVRGSAALGEMINELHRLRKAITILDFRRSMQPYKDVDVEILASSAHEVAVSVGKGPVLPADDDPSRFVLSPSQVAQMLERFPRVRNMALTCGAEGVQQGIRSKHGSEFTLSHLPPAMGAARASVFTPHCGDVFDVGLIVGLHAHAEDAAKACDVARVMAGLQASMIGYRRIAAKEIFERSRTLCFGKEDTELRGVPSVVPLP